MKKKLIHLSSCIWMKMYSIFFWPVQLLTILFFAGAMTVNASTYSDFRKLDLQLENTSLVDILDAIEKKSEFVFIFNANVKNLEEKRSICVEGKNIEKTLDLLFEGMDVSYRIDNQQIFLYQVENLEKVITTEKDLTPDKSSVQQQEKTISGKVTDKNGETIPGVTVMIKGTTIGTVTDIEGLYTLTVPESTTALTFSFVGMKTLEAPIDNQTTLSVVMDFEAVGLDEVVVVGYGVQKKASVVGSISQITGDDLKRSGSLPSLSLSLAGNLPGLVTIASRGMPGSETATMLIRGRSTWNNNDPLVLVDGIQRPIESVNTNDVESISVLKDASATAVFGVEGANGVILITTKRGSVSKPTLAVEGTSVIKTVSKMYPQLSIMDGLRHMNYSIEHEAGVAPGGWNDYFPMDLIQYYDKNLYPKDKYSEYADMFPNVDWQKVLINDFARSNTVNLSLRGGTQFVKYFASLGYLHEGDIMNTENLGRGYDPDYNYSRLDYRSNLDFDITTSTRFSVNLAGDLSKRNVGRGENYMLWHATFRQPSHLYPVQFSDGMYGTVEDVRLANAYLEMNTSGVNTNYSNPIRTDYKLNQKLDFITAGLSASANASVDYSINTGRSVIDDYAGGKYYNPNLIYANPEDIEAYTVYINADLLTSNYFYVQLPVTRSNENLGGPSRTSFYQLKLDYARQFNKHDITVMGVMNRRIISPGANFKTYREDWISRATYNYGNRYFVEINGAYNGSDNFAKGYRFDFFPSIGLGWTISNEGFLINNLPQINHLKFRYSFGYSGNDRIGTGKWPYEGKYSFIGGTRFGSSSFTQSPYGQWRETTIASPNIHWEVSEKQNIGFEFGVLQNLISGNLDYFTEHRTDIFLSAGQRNIPDYSGYQTNPAGNIGIVDSWGWELELKFSKTFPSRLRIWSNYNLTHSNNKIIFREDPLLRPAYQKMEGYAIGQVRTLINTGIMQNWNDVYGGVLYDNNATTLPGDFRQLDFNADGVINGDDEAPQGWTSTPYNTYSWSLGAGYKGFSAMAQLYGVFNVTRPKDDINDYMAQDNQPVVYAIQADHTYSPHLGQTVNATYHTMRWTTKNSPNASFGDYYNYDGSFLRLRTVELAYTFKENETLRKFGISSLKLYANGHNLAFWSKLLEDFEGGGGQTYPNMKRYTFGFSLNF